jgi:hypothetical protein
MGHNDIVKVLCSEIERAGGKAWTEPRFQLHHADDEHTDIRFSLGGQLVYVDVTVVHPTATYLPHRVPCAALRRPRTANTLQEPSRRMLSFSRSWSRRMAGLASSPVSWSS